MISWCFLGIGCGFQAPSRPGDAFDAGPVFAGDMSEVTHKYVVKNTTGEPVKIMSVVASCSCASKRLKKDTLAPGEETELEVSAKVPKAYSRGSISCTLKTDNRQFPEWYYALRFESIPRMTISRTTIHFGNFTEEDINSNGRLKKPPAPESVAVDVFNTGSKVDNEVPVLRADPKIKVELRPEGSPDQIANGIWHRKFKIDVSLEPSIEVGSGMQNRAVSVAMRDGFATGAIVSWRMISPLIASPSAISFGLVAEKDKSITRAVMVRSVKGRPFRLLSAVGHSSRGDSLEGDVPAQGTKPAVVHTIQFTFSPHNNSTRTRVGTLRITTDDPVQGTLVVPWSALVRVEARSDGSVSQSIDSHKVSRSAP